MCRHYVFVSSAGAYKANNIEPMHFEGDERKSSAGEHSTALAMQRQHNSAQHSAGIGSTSAALHCV
jgi:hypothetical protein